MCEKLKKLKKKIQKLPLKDEIEAYVPELYTMWKKAWDPENKIQPVKQKEDSATDLPKEDWFYLTFCNIYENVIIKKDNHKKQNFRWKYAFVFVYVLLTLCSFWYIKGNAISGEKIKLNEIVITLGSCMILIYIVCSIISKWLDIKQYQETWVRHSKHKSEMEQEMMRFLFDLDEYESSADKKKLFISRILKVWKANQDMFTINMNHNDPKLLEIFDVWFKKEEKADGAKEPDNTKVILQIEADNKKGGNPPAKEKNSGNVTC